MFPCGEAAKNFWDELLFRYFFETEIETEQGGKLRRQAKPFRHAWQHTFKEPSRPVLRRVIFWVPRSASPAKRRGPVELAGGPARGGGDITFLPHSTFPSVSHTSLYIQAGWLCAIQAGGLFNIQAFSSCASLMFYFWSWLSSSQSDVHILRSNMQ